MSMEIGEQRWERRVGVGWTMCGVVGLSWSPAARTRSGCGCQWVSLMSTSEKPIRNERDEALEPSFPSRSHAQIFGIHVLLSSARSFFCGRSRCVSQWDAAEWSRQRAAIRRPVNLWKPWAGHWAKIGTRARSGCIFQSEAGHTSKVDGRTYGMLRPVHPWLYK